MPSIPDTTPHMISALILGGTGAVGKALVSELLASGRFNPITIVGRRTMEFEGPNQTYLVQHTVDFANLDVSAPVFAGHEVIFCSFGTTRKAAGSDDNFIRIDQGYVLDAARLAQPTAKHFIYVSSKGAHADSRFLYTRTKGQTENMLRSIEFPHTTILRPGFLKTEKPREEPKPFEGIIRCLLPAFNCIFGEARISAPVNVVARAMRVHAERVHNALDSTEKFVILENPAILELGKAEEV